MCACRLDQQLTAEVHLQLSMDHVQVFPDGELNVQAAASRDTSPSFVRPITKARAHHRARPAVDVPQLQTLPR